VIKPALDAPMTREDDVGGDGAGYDERMERRPSHVNYRPSLARSKDQ
jgi:hypothetical protein